MSTAHALSPAQDGVGAMRSYVQGISRAVTEIALPDLMRAAGVLERAHGGGHTVFTCGNGGSATTASHFALDLTKNTRLPGVPPVRTMSLADQVPALTAWANDVGYEAVFSGQLAGLARPGDVLVAISTSGMSPNVLAALRLARDCGMATVGLLGPTGGSAGPLCDVWVAAPAPSIEEQEDLHMSMAHILTRHMRDRIRQMSTGSMDSTASVRDMM
ncbi:SIS domain-containing protein [Streptomyces sp. NPDC057052]|uniref:D-sedoheptulose-7-phosphate isomerase n=1 Tax=Streptomyces sp. NPDC057052 TaxID=3346010 RepID=UPI003630FBF7